MAQHVEKLLLANWFRVKGLGFGEVCLELRFTVQGFELSAAPTQWKECVDVKSFRLGA